MTGKDAQYAATVSQEGQPLTDTIEIFTLGTA
jgi:hypothetical protein